MKSIMILLAFILSFSARAQQNREIADSAKILPYDLAITWHKTTILIFPAAIQSADRGDQYILAERVKEVSNVLKVKAGEKNFTQSNLQVITTDGRIYSFTVSYADTPAYQTVDLRRQPPYAPVQFDGTSLNSKQIEDYTALVTGSHPFLKHIRNIRYGVKLSLDGIFIKSDVLFLRYQLKNTSTIPYEIASLRFYIRDRKKGKRTAEQDKEIQPLYVQRSGSPEYDKGQVIVVAFSKFTIAESKQLVTELMEDSGDRNPSFKLSEHTLLKAKPILQ